MYRFTVTEVKHGYKYTLYRGEIVIGEGYRPTERQAREDAAQDLKLAQSFQIGYIAYHEGHV